MISQDSHVRGRKFRTLRKASLGLSDPHTLSLPFTLAVLVQEWHTERIQLKNTIEERVCAAGPAGVFQCDNESLKMCEILTITHRISTQI